MRYWWGGWEGGVGGIGNGDYGWQREWGRVCGVGVWEGRKRSSSHKFCYLRPPAHMVSPLHSHSPPTQFTFPLPLPSSSESYTFREIFWILFFFFVPFFNTREYLPPSYLVGGKCNSSGGKFEIVFIFWCVFVIFLL